MVYTVICNGKKIYFEQASQAYSLRLYLESLGLTAEVTNGAVL